MPYPINLQPLINVMLNNKRRQQQASQYPTTYSHTPARPGSAFLSNTPGRNPFFGMAPGEQAGIGATTGMTGNASTGGIDKWLARNQSIAERSQIEAETAKTLEALASFQQQQEATKAFAQTLPEAEQLEFMVSPENYFAKQTKSRGQKNKVMNFLAEAIGGGPLAEGFDVGELDPNDPFGSIAYINQFKMQPWQEPANMQQMVMGLIPTLYTSWDSSQKYLPAEQQKTFGEYLAPIMKMFQGGNAGGGSLGDFGGVDPKVIEAMTLAMEE